MSHAAYLLARLNAKNARFDVGSGGIPDLTSEDVAGALAFVPAGIGRELLCRVWWPDGAALNSKAFDRMLMEAQLNEWSGREKAMFRALALVACAGHPTMGPGSRAAATVAYGQANRRRWPGILAAENTKDAIDPMERYAGIRRGVLAELSSPRVCTRCAGKGEVRAMAVIKICPRCNGEGSIAYAHAWRALAVGVNASSYSARWAAPYEWLLDLLTAELQKAEYELRRAIGGHDKAA